MPDLSAAIRIVVDRCLAIKPGEEVLVIVDPPTRSIGEAMRDRSAAVGADAVLAIMDQRETHGTEPPATVAAALEKTDVYIAPTSRSLSHTVARKRASEAGARGATMPTVTEEVLARAMAVDFDLMAARSNAVAALLSEADEAHFTCPRGSDLRLDLSSRRGIADDGDLTQPGAFGNLPCGEGFIAPLGGEGTIVASSIASLGLSSEPATLIVQRGHIADARGGFGPELIEQLRRHGTAGTNLAELGVGTNESAILTGNVLEDEKILGTVHVAFGASAAIGGTVSVPIHLDVVVLEATLDIGSTRVLDQGRYVLET